MSENRTKDDETKISQTQERFIPVQPSAEIISFVEYDIRVVLYKAMFVLVHCYNSQKVQIKTYSVEITPQEYQDWVDDSSMEALILQKCGLVKS